MNSDDGRGQDLERCIVHARCDVTGDLGSAKSGLPELLV